MDVGLTLIELVALLLLIPSVLMFGREARVRPPGRWFWVLAVVGVPVGNVAALALTDGSSVTVIWGVLLAEFAVLIVLLRAQRVTRLWTHAGGAILAAGGGSLVLTFGVLIVSILAGAPDS